MSKRICVLTRNTELGRKIQLMLPEYEVVLTDRKIGTDYERVFCDLDTCEVIEGDCIGMSRELESGDSTLHLPFRFSEFRAVMRSEKKESAYLGIDRESSSATLGGEKIKLTEVEMRLYERLYDENGYVSRDDLLDYVWHGESEAGVLNVYIHYLREKLEKRGEKIILSSRKYGYKINEIYRG